MLIYFLVIIISMLFSYVAYKLKKTNRTNIDKLGFYIFSFLSFLFPFLLCALRNENVGTDTNGTYYKIYLSALYKKFDVRDFGYYIFNRLCIVIFGNYRSILVFTSLIILGISYYYIFKKSTNPFFSTYLFFTTNIFFISMNWIRQCMATLIFLSAIPAIKERKIVKFTLIFLISFSIHSMSILYLPLLFLGNKKVNFKFCFFILFLLILFKNSICSFIFNILNNITYFKNYFLWYFSSSFNTGNLNFFSLLISLFILILFFLVNEKSSKNYELNCITWMQIISFGLLCLSSTFPMMQRTARLFSLPLFIYLPQIVDYIYDKNTKFLIKNGIFFGYGLYMIITIFVLHYNEAVPYLSMFE